MRGGTIVRSPWLDVPASCPLSRLPTDKRALMVLLAAGEEPTTLGRLLRVPSRRAQRAVREALAAAVEATGLHYQRRPRSETLTRIVPARRARWAFLLRASGAFRLTEIARLLRVHRASVYRDVALARSQIERHLGRR